MKTDSSWKVDFDIRARIWGDTKSICSNFENFEFLAIYSPWKIKKRYQNCDICGPKNGQIIKIFKIVAYTFCIILSSSPDIKTSFSSTVSLHIFVILCEIWVFFCLYGVSIGFCDPACHVIDHKMKTSNS